MGLAAVKVIYVRVQSFPSARHLSANFRKMRWTAVFLEYDLFRRSRQNDLVSFFLLARHLRANFFGNAKKSGLFRERPIF